MKDIIQAIGSVITSPYPYFAVFGYFGLQAFLVFVNHEANGYTFALFCLLIMFLSFLCVLVFVLIQKVGHASMLSPDYQIEIERMRLAQDKAKKELKDMVSDGGHHG